MPMVCDLVCHNCCLRKHDLVYVMWSSANNHRITCTHLTYRIFLIYWQYLELRAMTVFHCHSCHAPIELDESLKNLSKVQTDLITKKANQIPKVPLSLPSRHIPRNRLDLLDEALRSGSGDAIYHDNESDLVKEAPLSYDSKYSYIYVPKHDEHDFDDDGGKRQSLSPEHEDQLPDFSRIKSLGLVFDILSETKTLPIP